MDVDYRQYPILVVDDEPNILRSFQLNYGEQFTIITAEDGPRALELLRMHDPAVIVSDERMPLMSGAEFLERSRDSRPDAIRIMLTGYADLDALVRAINAGEIYRYVSKPWKDEQLEILLRQAFELFHLTRENTRLMEELGRANERLEAENAYLRDVAVPSSTIVGKSAAIQNVLGLIARVAPTTATVLIEGETGTGKELVARAIHAASPRRERLFIAVNCAAVAESLLEDELFGHKKGAFTEASSDRKGMIETADGGTLLLDEISSTTLAFQAKLLRVLQEGEVRRIGESQPRKVDVRVVAATNCRLEDEIKAGRFRQDLYFRLNVFRIRIPPLRERREDISALVDHFIPRLARKNNKPVGGASPKALAMLEAYAHPGNVRELENALERAIILADRGEQITEDLFPEEFQDADVESEPTTSLRRSTDAHERDVIGAALARAGGNKSRAAQDLGIGYRGLLKKMKRLRM